MRDASRAQGLDGCGVGRGDDDQRIVVAGNAVELADDGFGRDDIDMGDVSRGGLWGEPPVGFAEAAGELLIVGVLRWLHQHADAELLDRGGVEVAVEAEGACAGQYRSFLCRGDAAAAVEDAICGGPADACATRNLGDGDLAQTALHV